MNCNPMYLHEPSNGVEPSIHFKKITFLTVKLSDVFPRR